MIMKRYPPFLLVTACVLMAACSNDDSVIDPVQTAASVTIRSLELSSLVIDTDTVDVRPGTDKSPNDQITVPFHVQVSVQGSDAVQSLQCNIMLDGRSQLIATQSLEARGSDIWAATLQLTLRRGDVGDYRVEVTGTDKEGRGSNVAVAKLRIFYGSQPPVIHEVLAPDTIVVRSETFTEVIAVRVSDPSGLADIKQVFFNSFLPDGRAASGNPFIMRDDGQPGSGDEAASDGVYSIRISVPPTAMRGTHRFEFRAVDFSNLSSNVVIHRIVLL
jgi:hypothetical protein